MENISLFFIVLNRVPWIIFEGNQVSEILSHISFSFLKELYVSVENIFVAFKVLESEDFYHDFSQKLEIISAVAL